jgi:hypothetical protein
VQGEAHNCDGRTIRVEDEQGSGVGCRVDGWVETEWDRIRWSLKQVVV